VRVDDVVALSLPRSLEQIVALLGVIKAGAAYLPLDAASPPERQAQMLRNTPPRLVITTTRHAPAFGDWFVWPIDHPDFLQALGASVSDPVTNLDRAVPLRPEHGACVMYTSGTTGTPKGIVTPHRAVANLVLHSNYARLTSRNRVLQVSSIAFDAATLEIWGALLHGGTLVLFPSTIVDPEELGDELIVRGINTLAMSISTFKVLAEHRLSSLSGVEQILVGGETMPRAEVRRVFDAHPRCEFINVYGPAETTTFSCTQRLWEWDGQSESVPIGRPIQRTQVYVLDERLEPVPIGVRGELYLAGKGLARGYAHQPASTAERFLANPYGVPGTRMYRTGDVVLWRHDGALEFVGRSDDQVKIRGFRVELGEIETALRRDARVESVLVMFTTVGTRPQLVAYIRPTAVATSDGSLGHALQRDLRHRLPEYMVPSVVMEVKEWPISSTGKIDREALPPPVTTHPPASRPPRTPEEVLLCTLIADVLGLERTNIDDDFFALGGHSLLAMRLVSRIRAALNIDLSVRMVFEHPIVADLAEVLEGCLLEQMEQLSDEQLARLVEEGASSATHSQPGEKLS
jgi:amino acid adenylation domain-containing protein